jgi:hypothetical protein
MESQVCPCEPYPADVSDDGWQFAVPYSVLVCERPQRHYELRELFNAVRWVVRAERPGATSQGGNTREAIRQPTRRWVMERVVA